MFKKTLLALALTGLAGTAVAGTVSTTGTVKDGKIVAASAGQPLSISTEGSVGVDSVTPVDGKVTFKINNLKSEDYRSIKSFLITLSGATLSPATQATMKADTATATLLSTDGDNVTFGTATYPTATQILVPVTYVDGGVDAGPPAKVLGFPNDSTFEINGLDLQFDSKDLGSSITYTVQALSTVGNTEIDKGEAIVAEFVSELSAAVNDTTNFKETVDVAAGRKMFTGTTEADKLGTSVKVDVTTATADLLPADVTASEFTYTLNGDFSFLDVDSDGKIDKTFDLTGVVAKDLQSTVTAKSASKTATFDFKTDGSVILPENNYTVDVTFGYKTNKGVAQTFENSYAAGSWRLNGSGGFINFMPFSSQYAQSITVTNTGTVEAPISVTLTYNGETYTTTLDVDAKAKSITDISKKVADFAKEKGVVGNATVSINVASPTTSVDAIYYSKKDADRVNVGAK